MRGRRSAMGYRRTGKVKTYRGASRTSSSKPHRLCLRPNLERVRLTPVHSNQLCLLDLLTSASGCSQWPLSIWPEISSPIKPQPTGAIWCNTGTPTSNPNSAAVPLPSNRHSLCPQHLVRRRRTRENVLAASWLVLSQADTQDLRKEKTVS